MIVVSREDGWTGSKEGGEAETGGKLGVDKGSAGAGKSIRFRTHLAKWNEEKPRTNTTKSKQTS